MPDNTTDDQRRHTKFRLGQRDIYPTRVVLRLLGSGAVVVHALSGSSHTGTLSDAQHGARGTIVNAHAGADIKNTPAGNITSTDSQSALNELDTKKLALAGGTVTGATTFSALITVNAGVTLGSGSNLTSDSGTQSALAGAATLNKQSGTITSESLTTPAASTYTLTLTNSVVTSAARVFVSCDNGSNTQGELTVQRVTPSASQVVILVKNTGALAYNGTIKINFFVML